MKHILSTTALVASVAFAGTAFAQAVATPGNIEESSGQLYTWDVLIGDWNNSTEAFDTTPATTVATGTYAEYLAAVAAAAAGGGDVQIAGNSLTPVNSAQASDSLLDNILADAADLSASISNISQNLNDIDGSIDVSTMRDFDGIVAGMGGLVGAGESFGSFSQAGANVFGQDIPDTLLAVLDPLTLSLGALATTAIGTLQSGNMIGSFDADGLVSTVTTSSTAATTGANAAAEQYAGIADTIAMQNISVNTGAIDGSVALILADVNTVAGGIATTAIGALQSGTMEATIAGNMGGVTESTSAIVQALVGTGTAP